jgi:acyl-CoA synthetase (AMP-forming)/AMP-acid ligase II
MEVRIFDENMHEVPPGTVGEICCRGPAVFSGYNDNSIATARTMRGGWFHTGDLGKVDARGFVYVTGRESDMYISGGSNVYPREVEEVLLTHPDVIEVAIVGVPDAKWGESGIAVVVKKDGAAIDQDSLLGYLDGRCARYRWPRQVFFWDALPKSGYGKVVKKDIRNLLIERGLVAPPAH